MINIPSHIGIVIDNYSNEKFSNESIMSFINYVYNICADIGVKEITFYGMDNTNAEDDYGENLAVIISYELFKLGSKLLVLGNTESAEFPYELLCFAQKRAIGHGLKVNFLVNYSIEWDLDNEISKHYQKSAYDDAISNIDLISIWGKSKKVKDFLPMQTSSANLYFQKKSYYKFEPSQIYDAIMLSN